MELLTNGARQLGLDLTPQQLKLFQIYLDELVRWNSRVNLTAITDPPEVERLHFVDSLTVSLASPEGFDDGGSMVDVGTGAGFPGLPLKIAFPRISLTLVESTGKKVAFLKHLVEALGLEGVTCCLGRAEELAHAPELREQFDVAMSRALGPLPVVAELTLPFCRPEGVAIVPKKGDVGQEVAQATKAVAVLGGKVREVKPVTIPGLLEDERVLVVIDKVGATPSQYPRRSGIPAKRPL